MKDSINYSDKEIDPRIILEYLSSEESLTLSEFSQLTRFFIKYIDETDLSVDEKCLIATYLSFADVIMPEGKNHSCAGKRQQLQQYYFNNYKDCSIETNRIIADNYKMYYDQKIKQENERDEKRIENYHPEIYQEIVETRKKREKQKTKKRKHG